MKKIKRILSVSVAFILVAQLALSQSFASVSGPFIEMEEVFDLVTADADENGYVESYFVDENGNKVDFNTPLTQVDTLTTAAETLPTKYSLRDLGLVTAPKDQGASESCWAFSALGAMESNRLVEGKDEADFSEAHLVWFARNSATTDVDSLCYGDGLNHSAPYSIGANWMFSTAALSRWSGAAAESDYPFYPYDLEMMGNYSESDRYNTSGGAILYSSESLSLMADIKTWIMEKGAISMSFHYNDSYYNKTKSAYCCPDDSLSSNHAILVVGWDDYYSRSNFNTSSRPSYSGAFLCKNSWTTEWGDGGYFWLSYYDATISEIYGYVCADADTYDHNYSYNGLAYARIYSNTSVNGSQIANVFKSNGYESLSAISTFTVQDDVYAEVFVYKNLPSNYSKPNQGTLAYSSGKFLIPNAGYHTIPITKPVSLNPNERFSVVIRFSNEANDVYVVVEYNQSSEIYTSNLKESYIDLSGTGSSWYDSQSYGVNNNCIQAFTVCNHQPYEVTVPSNCINEGTLFRYCSQCEKELSTEVIGLSGHTYGGWETVRVETKVSDGVKERYCEVCGCSEEGTIPKITGAGGKKVTPHQLAEILKTWFEEIFKQIIERFSEKGVRSY